MSAGDQFGRCLGETYSLPGRQLFFTISMPYKISFVTILLM